MKKRKVPLFVEETFEGISPRPWSADERQEAMNRLKAMDAADAEVKRVEGAKNALEAFIYESREKVTSDEQCLKVSTEEDRANIVELLTQQEEWLYEEEAFTANASALEGKLSGLQQHVHPILNRALELEHRPNLEEKVQQVRDYFNSTLAYVKANMTWVEHKEITGVTNLSVAFEAWWTNVTEQQAQRALTEEPAYHVRDAERRLHKVATEAQRLTKIQNITKIPYSDYGSSYGGYGGYGGYGKDYWNDPKMRAFYENMYKNGTNGTNYTDWFRNHNNSNYSNFGSQNDSDYMRSFYDHAARNFSDSQNKFGPENAKEGNTEL